MSLSIVATRLSITTDLLRIPTYVSTTRDGSLFYMLIHCPGSNHRFSGPVDDYHWQTNDFKPPVRSVRTGRYSPVFNINGSFTASIGHKVTLDGTPTVLAELDLVPTVMAVAIGGVAESQYTYVVGGSSVATIGQNVIVDAVTKVVSVPTAPAVLEGGAAGFREASWNAGCDCVGAFLVLLL